MSQIQYCTFQVGELCFGIDVMKVQEVIKLQAISRVPLAPAGVCGLLNLRGQIVTAIELRRCLALPARPAGASAMNIILYSPEAPVSLVVDKMGDVLELDTETIEAAPQNLDQGVKALVEGVYKLEHEFLLVLNTDKVLELDLLQAVSARG